MMGVTLSEKEKKEMVLFWELVNDSGGFDVEDLMEKRPPNCWIYHHTIQPNEKGPTNISVLGRLGIHKYNLIHGTNFKLECIQYFNSRFDYGSYSHYITLIAKDHPAADTGTTFQTRIHMEGILQRRPLSVYCDIARLKPEGKPVQPGPISSADCDREFIYPHDWPQNFKDKKRYYTLKKSEYYNWVYLYMELAFINANETLPNPNLLKLEMVKATVETKAPVDPPSERLKALNAIFYIKYRYHGDESPETPKVHPLCLRSPRDRIAIVKRTMDYNNGGHLTLQFDALLSKSFL